MKFYFKSAFPDWTSVISGTLPKEQVATAEVFNNGMAKTYNNDWYAGPFKIESYNEAQQVVTLVPNEKWWGDKPLLDKVTFRVLDSAAEATSSLTRRSTSWTTSSVPTPTSRPSSVPTLRYVRTLVCSGVTSP